MSEKRIAYPGSLLRRALVVSVIGAMLMLPAQAADELKSCADIGPVVYKVMIEHLGIEQDKFGEAKRLKEDLKADELDLVELAMAFEEEFGVVIPDKELAKAVTVADVVASVKSKHPRLCPQMGSTLPSYLRK